MGHTNSSLIFRHYRETVLPTEAANYWNLTPEKAAQLVKADGAEDAEAQVA